jgi:hypothetical protein
MPLADGETDGTGGSGDMFCYGFENIHIERTVEVVT